MRMFLSWTLGNAPLWHLLNLLHYTFPQRLIRGSFWAQGVLDSVMALYLGISIPPISLSLRCTLHGLLSGPEGSYRPYQHALETIAPLAAALCIALTCPQV